jgi:hypothetical protein
MRRLLTVVMVAATTAFVPMLALAGNQDVANQIKAGLENSGKMSNYQIGVKYQEGTATLQGRVSSQEQMDTALKLVYNIPSVNRVVNELTIGKPQGSATASRVASSYANAPVQKTSATEAENMPRERMASSSARPIPVAMTQPMPQGEGAPGGPMPMYNQALPSGPAPMRYDQPCLPNYAWPSYAAYPNYAAVTYPKQYSPTCWPYIGPFYPYPQVPLGWRKVTLEWKDGWWFLDFKDQPATCFRR